MNKSQNFDFRFLFCLPKSVEQSAKRKEYDIVINDYARAKNLFGKTDVPVSMNSEKNLVFESDQMS